MIRKCLPSLLTAFAILTTFLFACLTAPAANPATDTHQETQNTSFTPPDNSVLHLIPEKTLGLIYCPNLLELDNRIEMLVTELTSQTEAPDGLTQALSKLYASTFIELTGLKESGLNLNQDFAIFLTSLKPMQISLLTHLTDPDTMKQMLTSVTKDDEKTEYKGITVWNDSTDAESFAILGDILVFSKQREICENVIDTYNGTMKTALKNPSYHSLFADISGDSDQLAVYLDVGTAIATLDRPLAEEIALMKENFEENDEVDNQMISVIMPFIKDMSEKDIARIEQVQSASIRLQLDGTDVHIKPFLKFNSDSEYFGLLQETANELAFLGDLPNRTFMNAAFQGTPTFLNETSGTWLSFVPQKTPEEQIQREALLEKVKGLFVFLKDRWSISFNLADYTTLVLIYELKDEQGAKAYMDKMFPEKRNDTDVYQGESIMHNRVEIKSYVFPDAKVDLPNALPEASDMVDPKWHWYYAFTDGQLIFTTGTSPESMQMALDRQVGSTEKFADHPSYQKLVDNFGTDHNVLLAISPIIAAKTSLPLVQGMDADRAAMFQLLSGLLMTMPENYSVSLSAKARDGGIDAHLSINLADFKQLGQMLGMISHMMQ